MANFVVTNSTTPAGTAPVATGSSYTTMILVGASTGNTNQTTFTNPQALKRGKLYDILVGTAGTPADNYLEYEVCRVTASTTTVYLGTVSSVSSAYMLDYADAGFGSMVTMNGSAGSSAVIPRGAQVWYVGVNQRASYRWVAAPGSELVWPAASTTAAGNYNGLALASRSVSGYTGNTTGSIMVSEQ